jgi:hypothetical protein
MTEVGCARSCRLTPEHGGLPARSGRSGKPAVATAAAPAHMPEALAACGFRPQN